MTEENLSGAADLPQSPDAPPRPPAVSVVIPCFGQARFLPDAIESVLVQSYPDFEIVVVDDGSPDETSEVVRGYPGVRLVRQANQGLSGARNAGLRESGSPYVIFLDADDRLTPGALEAGLECAVSHPECGLVWGQYRMIDTDGSRIGKTPAGCPEGNDLYSELLRRNCIGMVATVVFRREALEQVGGFDRSLPACEDRDVYLKIARRSSIHCHDGVVAEYRWHASNMSQDPARMLPAISRVFRRQWSEVRGHPRLERAYREGLERSRAVYGRALFEDAIARLRRRGERTEGLARLLLFFRHDPAGTFKRVAQRLVRIEQRPSKA